MSHKTNVALLHSVWDRSSAMLARENAELDKKTFDEIMASIFCPGPFYYYIVDFYDRTIKYMNPEIRNVLGLDPETTVFNDIIAAIHPDDIDFVTKAESKVLSILDNEIGRDKAMRYKMSYCFRFKTADGSYQLFQHQAIILNTDSAGGFAKSLNIHTNIHHITDQNNHKASLIGILGEPSYLNIDVLGDKPVVKVPVALLSKREIDVLRLISEGKTSKQIADALNISAETVKTHRRNILKKTDCSTIAGVITKCLQEGLI